MARVDALRRLAARDGLTIFLDDGGVMNDNASRALEWQRLVGEFLSPRLGGSVETWGAANQAVFERQWQRFEAWLAKRRADEHGDFFGSAEERERWLGEMCEHVGVASPGPAECVTLAIETERYVIPRVRAAFPGAVDAIRKLHERGYRLATASGTPSWDLEEILSAMGVRDCFGGRLYGPDLVQAFKAGPEYHRRIFADAGVEPERAIVVDDAAHVVGWAKEAGALAVLVSKEPQENADAGLTIGSLAELPALLG